MVRINEQQLRRQIKKYLSESFKSLVLENGSGENWVLQEEIHPETASPILLAQHGERSVVHPRSDLADVLIKLSQEGFIKHSYLLGQDTGAKRIKVDARYGKAKEHILNEQTLKKVSGGRADLIRPDNAHDLLVTIGIMKPSGIISAREQKKFKQINDFLRCCLPVLEKIKNRPRKDPDFVLNVADLACGNSYLAFVVAWYLKSQGWPHTVHGVDIRKDVIDRSIKRAAQLNYNDMSFEQCAVNDSQAPGCHLAVSLHACDTATDEAIMKAVTDGAEAILVAPCCQNELFKQLEDASAFPELCKQSLYRRAYGTVLTDSLRSMALEALGYKVKILEFTASIHTSKSLMIRAEKARNPQKYLRGDFFESCKKHGVKPAIGEIFDRVDAL
jgi:hypothetical protein